MKRLGSLGRKAAPPGSRRRRWFFAGGLAGTIGVLGVFVISNALAVHDEAFQLDGDVSAATTTHNGGSTQLYDWDSFFDSSGGKKALPTGFTASGFDRDFNTAVTNKGTVLDTSDDTTYTQGSKDTLNISSGWVCTGANNVTNKGDILNAYATAYTDPVSQQQFLYFAMERSTNTGDANVAFWFLQQNANCVAATGSNAWSGDHEDGDILIVSAFTKGGSVSTINAYRWNGGANGSLGTTPVASGADCTSSSQSLQDTICATANKSSISTPWLTDNNGATTGLGHSLLTGEFFEGGINLTNSNLAGKCFNTFVGDTRSSQSLTATLYDYARGSLGECTSTTQTTPTPSGSTEIPANAQVTASDSAKITVNGIQQFGGTVSFSLCGPLALSSTSNCQTGGTHISTATLNNATSPDTETSDSVTLTKVGRYCWRAAYSGDTSTGVPASSDPSDSTSTTECFSITPKTPTLTTCSGSYGGNPLTCTNDGTVDFGNAVRDSAHLTGTANEPGTGGIGDGSINPTGGNGSAQGTITFKLYGPDTAGSTANCGTLAAGFATQYPNGIQLSVNGDGVYGPSGVSFTPQAPGVYHWKATYGGDSPNTNSTSTNSDCSDSHEDVTVRQIPTSVMTKQSWFPNDTATITSTISGTSLGAGGTVDFTLYPSADCTGTALYTERQTLTGGNQTEEVGTHNYPGSNAQKPGGATVTPYREATGYADAAGSTVGPNSWKVVYTPASGDTAHTGSSSSCTTGHTEDHTITYTNDPGQ